VGAGFRMEVEVYGVFTRALLREADRRRMDAYMLTCTLSARSRGLYVFLNCDADRETGVRQHAPLAAPVYGGREEIGGCRSNPLAS
jgi:hypothetical protein